MTWASLVTHAVATEQQRRRKGRLGFFLELYLFTFFFGNIFLMAFIKKEKHTFFFFKKTVFVTIGEIKRAFG